jgi:YidC/Oxa1 family membrane protein insertase
MPEQTRTLLQLLPVVISFVVVWHLAAGLGLYWAGSTSVNLLQVLLLRRRIRRMPS